MESRNPGDAAAALPAMPMQVTRTGVDAGLPWRAALALLWPPALVAAVYAAVGRLGFFPTDEGLVLSYSYRILLGQVPHRDFISPRPLGSGLLHVIDFLVPGPLFEVSRVIALCEYALYGALFAWLIYEAAPWRWSLAMMIAAAASVLVNLNRFPLMAWYTVDGLLLVAVGLVVIQRGVRKGSWRAIAFGFFVLGAAALTKQSFVPAVAFGWLLLWPRLEKASWPARIRELVMTSAYGATPFIAFVAVIAALGGFHAMRVQLLGNAIVWGMSLLYPWLPSRDLVALVLLTVLSAGVPIAGVVVKARGVLAFNRIALAAVVVWVALIDQLGLQSDEWGMRLFWMSVAFVLSRSIAQRTPDGVGIALVGAGWMSSLSYSFFFPNLVGGTLAVYLLHRSLSEVKLPRGAVASAAPALAALVVLAITAAVFDNTRQQSVYLDRTGDQLTATLSGVSPAFGDIRTNPGTAAYLAQMSACIRQYPASRVAIFPENAAMYPALSLHNPFPIDWIWPYDVHGSEARIVREVDALNGQGDYLVMFQTVDAPQVISGDPLPAASPGAQISAFTPIPQAIYEQLSGTHAGCGPFLVVYAPPSH